MRLSPAQVAYKAAILFVVVVPFLAVAFAIDQLWMRAIHPSDVLLFVVMYSLVALGVTVGYHRMLSHRSFKPHPVVKLIFLILGSMSLEGDALQWASTHIKHHAQSDREGDPHSPVDGFLHAHLGWVFKEPDADPNVYARHLMQDKLVMFVSRTFGLWVALAFAIPFVAGWLMTGNFAGALTGLLWGGLVRQFFTHHVTWSVNSICHTFGKRAFETTDRSRNEWIVGLLAFGEGWHNNHHAFPRSAFHGLRWWQFDLSGYVIWSLEKLGLVRDVYRVTPEQIARRVGRAPKQIVALSVATASAVDATDEEVA
jgi:stearoyl-CoA desaturase (delta-9 desaturase)